MKSILTKLAGPIFYNMGVSEADFATYLDSCMPYIWGILGALLLMIIVLIAARWLKKGKRGFARWTAVICFLLVTAILANCICFGPLRSNISTMMNGSKIELKDETIAASKSVIKRVGEEGLVLLENNGVLPLKAGNINVFGWGSTNPILGGTGSGSSDGSTAVGILGSLADAGFKTNAELTKLYTDYRADRPSVAMYSQDWTLPEPTVDAYTDAVMAQATGFSDTAVIVISRSGGEGADLPTDMYGVIHGTYDIASRVSVRPDGYGYYRASYTNNGSYDDFEQGEHYLELSVTEENMVAKVCSAFEKVVVVINANNAMELGWVKDYPQIGAVILAPGAGSTGLSALGEIMAGTVNPSGRTADTFVKDLTATPTWSNFGNFSYTNVDDLKQTILTNDGAYEGNLAFVNYVEGIYVGYKFYETAADEGLISYEDAVMYPFGYGLSYTSFEKTMSAVTFDGTKVTFDVTVKNTGSAAGKDVVEVYYTPPYVNGGIEKASVNLADFAKTDLLQPGASQTLSFAIPVEDMASYDCDGIKLPGGGYILEAGEYVVSVRSDSHTVLASGSFTVDSDISYASGRSGDKTAPANLFQDYSRGSFTQLSRADHFANYAEAVAAPAESLYVMSDELRAAVEKTVVGLYDPTLYDDASDVMPTLGAKNGLKLAALTGKGYDDANWDKLLDQMTFEEMVTLINMGGWSTAAVESIGKIATSDCDGPAGLSNFLTGAYGTAYPAEVLMAMTWNTALIGEMGDCMGQEYEDANNFGWYGPAMNTHRSAFAGRNFEYYSEDGLLAGRLASAEINGAAKHGVYAEIKHFALNDQEGNRCTFLLTFASEQAMREIYLKPFELAVKGYTGTGIGAMSSFNFIGHKPSCSNPELLNKLLRDEWGFVGFVETDYNGSYGYMLSDQCVRNGNDLMLGFGFAASNAFTDQSATAVKAMRQACKNILYVIGNSGYYLDGDPTNQPDVMKDTFVKWDIIGGVGLLALEALGAFLFLRKKKEQAA